MLCKTFKKMFIAKIDVLNKIHQRTNCKDNRQTNLSKIKFKSSSQQIFNVKKTSHQSHLNTRIRNFRKNFHFFNQIRIIYIFREFFKIVFILLAIRSIRFNSEIISISISKIVQIFINV